MKYFKIMILLFIFLFVGCSSVNSDGYNTQVVSSNSKGYNYASTSNKDEEILMSNIMVYNRNYSKFLGIKYKEHNTYGSGFIFKEDENHYYVLTNNHVVSYDYSYNYHQIIVEDYYGNLYEGKIITSDSRYDLAVVRFNKSVKLKVLDIVDNDGLIGEEVRSMGNPNSTKNVINKGRLNCYSIVNVNSDKSNVNFDVLVHSALIRNGSSGSALLNNHNKVVGVTFAGVFDDKDNFITGYAIPASKINEFLNK